jgi:hypothetical protein
MANVVLPKVRMFVPCLGISLDPSALRTIYGPLHTIRMPPGIDKNYEVEELWFYVVLTDGVGTFRLSVEMRSVEDIVLAASQPRPVTLVGGEQLNAKDLGLQLESAPFPRPGVYEFRLIANHAHLDDGGTAFIRLLQG